MTVRLERIGENFGLVLTPQQIAALGVPENAELTIESHVGRLEVKPVMTALPRHIEAYRRTRPDHDGVYRELAK